MLQKIQYKNSSSVKVKVHSHICKTQLDAVEQMNFIERKIKIFKF